MLNCVPTLIANDVGLCTVQLECLKFGCDLLVSDRPDILHASLEEWRELNLSAMGGEKLIRSS